MATYSIKNSAGSVVSTITVGTTTGAAFPIELAGQGISLYGEIIGTTQYRLLENFSNTTPPTNPVTGMNWYDGSTKTMNYYDGTNFVPLGSAFSSAVKFPMDSAASSIDMTTTGSTTVFTNPNAGNTYYPTGLLVTPVGNPTATTAALVQMEIVTAEDVLETVSVRIPDSNSFGFYVIQGTTKAVTGSLSVKLVVATAASGGSFTAKVELLGLMG